MQTLTIAGVVGKNPALRRMQSGDPVLNFSVGVSNGKDKNGNWRETTWYDCALWGKRAEAMEPYITQGLKITVTGRPTVRVHEGKAYLGVNVNDFTLQGGGQAQEQREEQGTYGGQSNDQSGGYGGGYDAPGGYGDGLSDEIPF